VYDYGVPQLLQLTWYDDLYTSYKEDVYKLFAAKFTTSTKFDNLQFSDALNDPTSSTFKSLAGTYCDAVSFLWTNLIVLQNFAFYSIQNGMELVSMYMYNK
jgi:hypothetical protein